MNRYLASVIADLQACKPVKNCHGHVNGWTKHVYGKSVDVYW